MSESFVKFYLDTEIVPYSIVDAETGDAYPIEDEVIFETVVNLLNEQQTTISNQEQRIKILQQEISDTQAILEMLTEKLKGWNDDC